MLTVSDFTEFCRIWLYFAEFFAENHENLLNFAENHEILLKIMRFCWIWLCLTACTRVLTACTVFDCPALVLTVTGCVTDRDRLWYRCGQCSGTGGVSVLGRWSQCPLSTTMSPHPIPRVPHYPVYDATGCVHSVGAGCHGGVCQFTRLLLVTKSIE